MLPTTGVAHLGLILLIAGVLLSVGLVALAFARSRRAGGAAALLVVPMAASALLFLPGSAVRATASHCVIPDDSLTITQTSTVAGLIPGAAAIAITGKVVNNGGDTTSIVAIAVEILSVTRDPGAYPGDCGPSDFTLLRPRMPVGQILSPGGSTSFSGAAIRFNNKSTNQDACKRATVQLRYITSS